MNSESASDHLIGAVLASRYRIEARVGDGSMGAVYRARHVRLGREFAVKVLRPMLTGDPGLRRRFLREAELAGALHHPGIVGMVDIGETSTGLCYLVMEYASGDTLYDLIMHAAPLPAPRVIAIVRQLCEALAHAHERRVIHRDLKPENVIVDLDARGRDRIKIIDFGIAILRDEAVSSSPERLTTAGLVLGTPHYMAPEQALGDSIDHRVDLFALGVMCFEMLTGRAPFDGDGVEVAHANVSMDTPAMRDRAPGQQVDPLLEAFTRRLMSKSRDARPPTASAARALIDLIERDRRAAAYVLDVPLEIAAPRTAQRAPSLPQAVLAAPALPAPRAEPVALTRSVSRRRTSIAAAATVVAMSAALAIVTLIEWPATPRSPRPAAPLAPSPPRPAVAAIATEPTAPRPGADRSVPPPAPTDPASIAQLHAAIGQELRALDQRRGAAADLWPAYLRIRIHEALADPARREEVAAALQRLHAQIGKRGDPHCDTGSNTRR